MKVLVGTDLHFFAPHAFNTNLIIDNRVIHTGDIYDRKNCHKSKVGSVSHLMNDLKDKVGERYLYGNHEMTVKDLNDPEIYYKNGWLFTHYDYFAYSYAKYYKWRVTKECGSSSFKRSLVSISNVFRKAWPFKGMSKSVAEKVFEFMNDFAEEYSLEVKGIVGGHFHPNEVQIIEKYGRKIYVLPRGYTELNLD